MTERKNRKGITNLGYMMNIICNKERNIVNEKKMSNVLKHLLKSPLSEYFKTPLTFLL